MHSRRSRARRAAAPSDPAHAATNHARRAPDQRGQTMARINRFLILARERAWRRAGR